jgi:hypothetical protein
MRRDGELNRWDVMGALGRTCARSFSYVKVICSLLLLVVFELRIHGL